MLTEAEIAGLEDVERAAWRDVFAAAPPPLAESLGLRVRPWGRALAFAVDHLPSLLFNRVLGLAEGAGGGADRPWDEILAFYQGGSPAFAVEWTPAAESHGERMAAEATARGFTPGSPTVKWTGDPGTIVPLLSPAIPSGIAIREVLPQEAPVFGELMATIFGGGASNALWTGATVGRPGWRLFFALDREDDREDGGRPVGVGALYLRAGEGWLGWGGVLASHRGRGLQRRLLAARVEAARAAGCRRLVLETGLDSPERPNPSHRNVAAAGFQPAYRRSVWIWRAAHPAPS